MNTVAIVRERRRALTHSLHARAVFVRRTDKLRAEAEMCRASISALDGKLATFGSFGGLAKLRDELRACSSRLDRAINELIGQLPHLP
jgi:hypothetical protein